MKQSQKEYFSSLLHGTGFKATPSRIELLRVLTDAKQPFTVEEIISRLKQSTPDQATVYRALKELKEAQIIRQVDFQHGHAHYELSDKKDHHHLICMECEEVEDFTGCAIKSISKLALQQSKEFKTITEHSLELFGICKSCSKTKVAG